jgi:hypothetical protein
MSSDLPPPNKGATTFAQDPEAKYDHSADEKGLTNRRPSRVEHIENMKVNTSAK